MANQFFRFKQFTVHQQLCAMKVGTDGTLLGAWAAGGARILDIGTGTGLIALMMAQRFPSASVTAIDIVHEACLQARQNAEASPFAARVSVVESALQAYAPGIRFDSIVSNPPYFSKSLKNPDALRTMARHTDTLSYEQLFRGVDRLLDDGGEFSAIIPFDCLTAFTQVAADCGFFLTRECAVKTTPTKSPRRYLLAFRRQPVTEVQTQVGIIEDAPNVRSEWYKSLTADFYLAE